jgi:hypothetical protein
MNKLAAALVAMGGAWLSATACKSDPLETERVPAASFGAAFSKALCDNAASCCSRSSFTFDHTNCEGRRKASLQALLDQELTGPIDYDEVAAAECLARLEGRSGCGLTSLDLPACEGMLVGRLEDGEPCERDVTCKSGWCVQPGEAAARVCTPLQGSGPVHAGKAGDPCLDTCEAPGNCPPIGSSQTPTVCYRSDGLFCDYREETQTETCEPLREVGEPCEADRECAGSLFCQGLCEAPACVDGECVESALSEEACTSGTNF